VNLHDAEELKRLVVEPMIESIRAELRPLTDKVSNHEQRVGKIESNQKKALGIYAMLAMFGGMGFTAGYNWVVRKFHLG
jgi:hypothetical protein